LLQIFFLFSSRYFFVILGSSNSPRPPLPYTGRT
jgi:hypothetical protein